ncbi:MAG: DUF4190 domain-containing protein [Planctomycetota bacterium]|jgi:hypothetical protein
MKNVSNISSEEELLQLRNEDKVSEDEYEELLETLRTRSTADVGPVCQVRTEPGRTCGLAIASLVLALALGPFGLIPAAICGHLALRKIEKNASLRGRGLALAGLIAGYSIFGLTVLLSIPILVPALVYHSAAESRRAAIETIQLMQFPLDDTEGLITRSDVGIDKTISSDGNGSLRIEATGPTKIRLFETGDIDVESARLIYQAKLRTENVAGLVYLEMWCHFPGKGEFFSRGLTQPKPSTGTKNWTTEQIFFLLREAENPDNIKLNLVISGKGTVWIDDIRLLKASLTVDDLTSYSSLVVPEQDLQTLTESKAGTFTDFSYDRRPG